MLAAVLSAILLIACTSALQSSIRPHRRLIPSPLQQTTTATDAEGTTPPRCYVVISNLQSGSNVGSICRNALAFNAHAVVVVGRKNFRDKMRQADRGAKERLRFVHVNSVAEARAYLKAPEIDATIVGIEILDDAVPITAQPFTTPATAFMFGNEGGGLSERQREACDRFAYIPQYAADGGMASINVACASAVVLQAFAAWARYPETRRQGEKFV